MTNEIAVIPMDYEFDLRNRVNRARINVALQVREAARVRAFTKQEVTQLSSLAQKEQRDYADFCAKTPDFNGIFYPQLPRNTFLTVTSLAALDKMQEIVASSIRLIHQSSSYVSVQEFMTRVADFMKSHPKTRNLPVLDLEAKNRKSREVLVQKVDALLAEDYKEIAVIFRPRKGCSRSWNLVFPRLVEAEATSYVFEVPTKRDGGFAPMIYPLLMGATKVCHRRNQHGWGGQSGFIEPTWELIPQQNMSPGVADYGGQNRIEFLNQDRRASAVYPFSRWDRIVQANEFCQRYLNGQKLTQVVNLEKARRHFTQ